MLGAIAGDIAEGFYGGVPREVARQVCARLDPDLLDTVQRFRRRFQ